MKGVQLRMLHHLFRPTAMVRDRMMRFGETERGIGPLTYLARHHESEDSSQVCLIGDGQQIEHQTDVLLIRLRYTDRLRRHVRLEFRLRRGLFNAPFDFPHVVEILVEPSTITGAETGLEVLEVADNEIENASVG